MFSSKLRTQSVVAPLAVASLLLLPACHHIPCLPQAEPGAPSPADFNGLSSSANSAQMGVREFYQDPLLTTLVAQALAANQELKILDQDIELAANEILLRRGAYLPFGALRAEAGVDKHSLFTPLGAAEKRIEYYPGKEFPDPLPNFLLSFDLFWQIDIWRELRNARDAAIQRHAAAIERRNAFVTRMVAEIATNYYELMAADQRLEILDQIIGLQEQSLEVAQANKEAGRDTELAVQRFEAEVQKNRSEKLIVRQQIIQAENRINFLRGAYPQPVERRSGNFLDLNLQSVQMGLPAQLLQFRPDVRAAEREVAAAGLDVLVARAHFFPRLDLTGSVGFEAFNARYFFDPDALVGGVAGGLVQPLINWKAIQADYLSANARQLQAIYEYQRVVLNAFTEVVNNLAKAQNFGESVEVKKQQLAALEISVDVATKLFQNARADYVDVLFSQRDLMEARTVLVETKQQQLAAIVAAYQALGGGLLLTSSGEFPADLNFIPPEPGPQLPMTPAPEEDPDAQTGPDGASIDDGSAGRATISIQTDDAAVSPLFEGSPTVDQLFEPSAESESPRPFPDSQADAGFEFTPAPGVEPQAASPTDSQPVQRKVDATGDDQPRSSVPAPSRDSQGGSRAVKLLGNIAITGKLKSASGSRELDSEQQSAPAGSATVSP